MNSSELNQALLQTCILDSVDYAYVEELLQRDANPLGKILYEKYYDNLYTAVVSHYIDYENDSEAFYKLTELFNQYGMRMDAPEIPYDDDNILHPLWFFGFPLNTVSFRVLKLLLDNGLDADSAREAWNHDFFDHFHVGGKLVNEFCYQLLFGSLKKLLLIASYPHILDADEELQEFIWLSQNQYNPLNFRDFDNYSFEVDTSKCLRSYPEVYRSIVTVKEKNTGVAVWKMCLGLSPEEV